MSLAKAREIGAEIRSSRRVVKLGKGRARCCGTTCLTFWIDQAIGAPHKITADFAILDGLNQDIILGMETMRSENATIMCASNQIIFAPPVNYVVTRARYNREIETREELTVIVDDAGGEEAIDDVDLFHVRFDPIPRDGDDGLGALDGVDSTKTTTVTSAPHPAMQELLARFRDTVFQKLDSLPPSRGDWDFRIDLIADDNPTKQRHFKMSEKEKEAVRAELDKLILLGWIEPSQSAWSCPILFARNKKKDGSLRAVYDFRKLNAKTRANAYPVPRIDDILDRLSGARVYSTIDLSKAFNQVRNAPDAVEKTAISTPFGLWQSKVMLMGLRNAGAHFQALIEAVMRGDASALPRYDTDHPRRAATERLKERLAAKNDLVDLHFCAAVYIDDIVIFSDTIEQHKDHVTRVLERLEMFDLRANEFFLFGAEEIDFLGFNIQKGAVRPLAAKVEAITAWPTPNNASDIRTFMGVVQYYRDCIPQLANFASVLTALTSKKAAWQWTEREQMAFDMIKALLANATALRIPDHRKPYVVATDASIYGLGGVLMQRETTGLYFIAFYSKQISRCFHNHFKVLPICPANFD